MAAAALLVAATAVVAAKPRPAAAATLSPGSLNSAFGSGGVVKVGSPVVSITGEALVPAGAANADDVAVSANTNGTAEAILYAYSNSSSPVFTTSGFAGQANAVAVAPGPTNTGYIVIAGYENNPGGGCTATQAAAIEEFSTSGQVVIPPTVVDCNEMSQFSGVSVDSAGNIVAAGIALQGVGHVPATLVARLTSSGTPDSTFATGGFIETDLPGAASSQANAVTLVGSGATGQVLVTGMAQFTDNAAGGDYMYLARFVSPAPGQQFGLDTSFGSPIRNGVVEEELGVPTCSSICSSGDSIITLTNSTTSNIVVAGSEDGANGPSPVLAQYDDTGLLVPSFGSSGIVPGIPSLGTNQSWQAVTYQANQGLLTVGGFAGSAGSPTVTSMVVAQFYATSGQLNQFFGSHGSTSYANGQGKNVANGVVVEPDGSTIAAGTAPPVGNSGGAALIGLTGPLVTIIIPGLILVTSSGPVIVNFTITLNEPFPILTSVILCSVVSALVNGSQQCGSVNVPAGATSAAVPVQVPVTVPVGSQQSVPLSTVGAGGVSGQPGSGSGTATVQHLPPPPGFAGYYMVASDGGIFSFGGAGFHGSTGNIALARPIVGMATRNDGTGYWMVASDGGIFAFGNAGFFGSTGAIHLARPIVGMAVTPDDNGYWLVASDGGIFSFGDAHFYGSAGAIRLAQPIVGMASTPDGGGYWLVASDGGIFSFGDAGFEGSTGAIHLAKPIVGMAAYPGAPGYWLVASDGGVFSFGAAGFHGSTGAIHLAKPIVGMASSGDGQGYWLVASDGGIFSFGDTQFFGSTGNIRLAKPIVGIGA